jgi:hypothetical protein
MFESQLPIPITSSNWNTGANSPLQFVISYLLFEKKIPIYLFNICFLGSEGS